MNNISKTILISTLLGVSLNTFAGRCDFNGIEYHEDNLVKTIVNANDLSNYELEISKNETEGDLWVYSKDGEDCLIFYGVKNGEETTTVEKIYMFSCFFDAKGMEVADVAQHVVNEKEVSYEGLEGSVHDPEFPHNIGLMMTGIYDNYNQSTFEGILECSEYVKIKVQSVPYEIFNDPNTAEFSSISLEATTREDLVKGGVITPNF